MFELHARRMTVAHIRRTGERAAPADQLTELDALLNRHEVPSGDLQLAVIDVSNDQTLHQSSTLPAAGDLVRALADKLPRPAYEGQWIDDYERARMLAAALERPTLIAFTGSGWAEWSIRLDEEVFTQEDFKAYARDHLVLMRVDFPDIRKPGAKIDPQDRWLAHRFAIRGVPMMKIVSAAGDELGEMTYVPGGPEPFLAVLKQITERTSTAAAR
jgi:protein disulfide-isomerase